MICDGVSSCHDPRIIAETDGAMRVLCAECKHQFVLRKDHRGVPEKRECAKIFKRDVLQGSDSLLYKYRPDYLRT